jgi:hypothetical protein
VCDARCCTLVSTSEMWWRGASVSIAGTAARDVLLKVYETMSRRMAGCSICHSDIRIGRRRVGIRFGVVTLAAVRNFRSFGYEKA